MQRRGSPQQRRAVSQQRWGFRLRWRLRQQKTGLISRRDSGNKRGFEQERKGLRRGGYRRQRKGFGEQRKGCGQKSEGFSQQRGAHAAEGGRAAEEVSHSTEERLTQRRRLPRKRGSTPGGASFRICPSPRRPGRLIPRPRLNREVQPAGLTRRLASPGRCLQARRAERESRSGPTAVAPAPPKPPSPTPALTTSAASTPPPPPPPPPAGWGRSQSRGAAEFPLQLTNGTHATAPWPRTFRRAAR